MIKRLMQPVLWWLYQWMFRVHSVDGLRFLDVRSSEDGSRHLLDLLADAMSYVQGDHKDLVTSELAFVAATRHPRESISVRLRAYLSPFVGHEGANGFYLACRLVWIASYLRQHRQAREAGQTADEAAIRVRAAEAQMAFIETSPAGGEWKEYLEREHTRDRT